VDEFHGQNDCRRPSATLIRWGYFNLMPAVCVQCVFAVWPEFFARGSLMTRALIAEAIPKTHFQLQNCLNELLALDFFRLLVLTDIQ
jgi:hypothetical protein